MNPHDCMDLYRVEQEFLAHLTQSFASPVRDFVQHPQPSASELSRTRNDRALGPNLWYGDEFKQSSFKDVSLHLISIDVVNFVLEPNYDGMAILATTSTSQQSG